MPESAPFTAVHLPGGDDETMYRSVPGRGVSDARRIDIVAPHDISVEFYRLKPARGGGIERILLWDVPLFGGTPLIWPVPDSARMDDLLLIFRSEEATIVSLGDHWSST